MLTNDLLVAFGRLLFKRPEITTKYSIIPTHFLNPRITSEEMQGFNKFVKLLPTGFDIVIGLEIPRINLLYLLVCIYHIV